MLTFCGIRWPGASQQCYTDCTGSILAPKVIPRLPLFSYDKQEYVLLITCSYCQNLHIENIEFSP